MQQYVDVFSVLLKLNLELLHDHIVLLFLRVDHRRQLIELLEVVFMVPEALLNTLQEILEALSEESEAVGVFEDVDNCQQVVALAWRERHGLVQVADSEALEDILNDLDSEVEVGDELVWLDVLIDGLQLAEILKDVWLLRELNLVRVLKLRLDQVLLLEEDYQILNLDDVRQLLALGLGAGNRLRVLVFFNAGVWDHRGLWL